MTTFDRTVHATTGDGGALVRYERSGKWYLEYPGDTGRRRPRRCVLVRTAVELATAPGSKAFLGLAGGQVFDAAYRRAAAATPVHTELHAVHLSDDEQSGARDAAFDDARALARAGTPTVVFWYDPLARCRTARVFSPSGAHADIRAPRSELTTSRVITATRHHLQTHRFDELKVLLAFARTHMDFLEGDARLLTRIEALAALNAVCDHERRCCPKHDTHASPHVGCILR